MGPESQGSAGVAILLGYRPIVRDIVHVIAQDVVNPPC
jgi:hypothetical protein